MERKKSYAKANGYAYVVVVLGQGGWVGLGWVGWIGWIGWMFVGELEMFERFGTLNFKLRGRNGQERTEGKERRKARG
jgi:hypothetical protein